MHEGTDRLVAAAALLACQWLSHLGVEVIGTVGTRTRAELAAAHGCAHPIVHAEEDFVARVWEITSVKGVPVVYDSMGKATFEGSLDCLERRGLLVAYGNASGKPDPFDALELAARGSLFLTRPTLFDYVPTREALLASAGALFDVVMGGADQAFTGEFSGRREGAGGRYASSSAASWHATQSGA